jgi:hypothetical protein
MREFTERGNAREENGIAHILRAPTGPETIREGEIFY